MNDIATPAAMPQAQAGQLRLRDWLAFWAINIGGFVALLDIQIVASSISEIRAGLSASVDEIQWVQTSYLIAEIIAIPLSGYLAPMLSTRVYYTIAAAGFTLASLACGFSWSLGVIVVFRALQGFLGGGMIPALFAVMYRLFPSEKQRELPQLIAGLTTMLAPAIGPTFGGWITDTLSWRWLFLINFVPGIACALIVWFTLDVDRPQPRMRQHLSLWSVALLALFLGSTQYTLDEGPRHDWFDDDSVAVTAVLAMLAGGLFFRRMLRAEMPLVDLRVFRNRNFAVTSAVSALLGVSIFTLNYLTPLFLAQVAGYDAQQIGTVMVVAGITMIVVAPAVIRVANLLDPRLVISIGLVLVSIGSWTNAGLTADWGYAQFLLPQALRGAGLIFVFVPMTNLALGTLRPQELNNASALYAVTRNLGGAIGLALVTTFINQRSWSHWQMLTERLRWSQPLVRESLGTMSGALHAQLGAASDAGAVGWLAQQVSRQVASMTYGDLYLLLTWSPLLSILLVPLIRRPRGSVGGMGH
jgi:DHA2 family multidrug resistance protein